MPHVTRRRFLEDSIIAAAAAASMPALVRAEEAASSTSPGEKITLAILGCGIRGKAHAQELANLPDTNIAYVCDPDPARAAELAELVVSLKRPAPKTVADLRTVLDDKSVDAVTIATCNHWHALAAIWAMQAGKDAYVEKPVSHNVSEGRRVVQVARKTGRICQGGTQNRSNAALAAAIDYIKQGKLGPVKLARSVVYGRRNSIGGPGKCEMPPGVDYNLWAGPAPMTALTRPKFHYDWHWFWDTGNGELGNNNIHSLDICRWGLDVSGLGRSVLSYGGRVGYVDAAQTPNTQVCVFDFGDKTIVSETRGLKTEPFHANFKAHWIFYGSEGIICGTSLFDPQGNLLSTFPGKFESHFANFLQAVRSRKHEELHADVLETHQSTSLCHVGNISWRLGQQASPGDIRAALGKLPSADTMLETFDRTVQHLKDNEVDLEKTRLTLGPLLQLKAGAESFVDNSQADALLSREYRQPFVVPGENQI